VSAFARKILPPKFPFQSSAQFTGPIPERRRKTGFLKRKFGQKLFLNCCRGSTQAGHCSVGADFRGAAATVVIQWISREIFPARKHEQIFAPTAGGQEMPWRIERPHRSTTG
jgi:hypothetical protein